MNESLMKMGLPEFNISQTANSDTISVTASVVNEACDNLDKHAARLDNFIMDLENQKEEILRDWEGEAADKFRMEFPKMIEAFQAVPVSVRSISAWTMSTKNAFMKIDQNAADVIGRII